MSVWKRRLVVLSIFVWTGSVLSSDFHLEGIYSGEFHLNIASDWHYVRSPPLISTSKVCKDNVTTQNFDESTGTLEINFSPKDQHGVLGVSICRDESREDCYVIEIFGLVSGRLGYFWRKHSRNETGEELWVPGRNTKLPSSLIKSDVAAKKGTWDRRGRTVYRFYVESIADGYYVEFRYNGGTAKQQREMTFKMPQGQYLFYSVASYNNDSDVDVEGAIGCVADRRFTFEPGQLMQLYWKDPLGAIGISFCTDSSQYDCYVFEIFGVYARNPLFFWRKHSFLEEDGEEAWVPGLDTKTKGIVLKHGISDYKFMDDITWRYKADGLRFYLRKSLDGKVAIRAAGFRWIDKTLQFDLPSSFQYAVIQSRVIVDGKEVNRADFTMHEFNTIFIKPGKAEASVVSDVLEPTSTRITLCVSFKGMAGLNGGKVTVTATDASENSNETVHLGQMVYNNIYPLDTQLERMSADLPPALQNIPLKVSLTAARPTPESFVLLEVPKLCSFDGCGITTAHATPFIAYGKKTTPAKYPWHVAIFHKINKTSSVYICGGTLVRSDAVVSAAHCFFDERGNLLDKSKFQLAAGKKFNSINAFEPNQQYSNALSIDLAPIYRGEINHFIHDIAIIRVNFTTSSKVLPACLDWFGNNASSLQPGEVGQVAGWGVHEQNTRSEELYFTDLPFVPYDECIKAIPQTFVPYVMPDKFCAGYINGSTVKKGDSGGGLVFKKGGLWYLRGVVSVGRADEFTYSTFTEVSQFMPWIKKMLNVTDS